VGAADSIVVLGLLGQFPLAGIAWQLIHHLAGLQQLGPSANTASNFRTDVTQIFDAVSLQRDRHSQT